MTSRLITVGDSFVFGLNKHLPEPSRVEMPFGKILAELYQKQPLVHGICGGSNQDIFDNLKKLNLTNADTVIVVWSGTERLDANNKKTDPIKPISRATTWLKNIGCKYYYASSFIDYRLIDIDIPSNCTKNWLWWDQTDKTLYDQCLNAEHDLDHSPGKIPHGNNPICPTRNQEFTPQEIDKLSNRFHTRSPHLAECHHPNQQGHELIAKNMFNEIGENLHK